VAVDIAESASNEHESTLCHTALRVRGFVEKKGGGRYAYDAATQVGAAPLAPTSSPILSPVAIPVPTGIIYQLYESG
jgi:hypothetical protein